MGLRARGWLVGFVLCAAGLLCANVAAAQASASGNATAPNSTSLPIGTSIVSDGSVRRRLRNARWTSDVSSFTTSSAVTTRRTKRPLGRLELEERLAAALQQNRRLEQLLGESRPISRGGAGGLEWALHDPELKQRLGRDACWSLQQQESFYSGSGLKPSRALLERLRAMEVMHRQCVGEVIEWGKHFQHLESGRTDCRYIIVELQQKDPLGNQLLALVGALEYALISGRALLAAADWPLRELLCEVFPASSMWLPPDILHSQSFEQLEDFMAVWNKGSHKHVAVHLRNAEQDRYQIFFCDKVQGALWKVPWLSFVSLDQYLGPGLFLVPSLEKRLLRLFPDRLVTPHTVRYLLSPANRVWERITRTFRGYLAPGMVRVGVDVRGLPSYEPGVSNTVMRCLLQQSILPSPLTPERWDKMTSLPGDASTGNDTRSILSHISHVKSPVTAVFVAAEDPLYCDDLRRAYDNQPPEDHSVVTFHSETRPSDGLPLDVAKTALMEMWLLSMSDYLLISPASTPGYIAKALSGRNAYFLSIYDSYKRWDVPDLWPLETNNVAPCIVSRSPSACLQHAPRHVACSDEQMHGLDFGRGGWPIYVKSCQDALYGVEIVPLT